MMSLSAATSHAAETVALAQLLAYAVVALGSAVLLYYLSQYVSHVLAGTDTRSWLLLGVGIAAGIVYGIAGLVDTLTDVAWAGTFAEGATLFFILFAALGIRQLYFTGYASNQSPRALPAWVDHLVVTGFVASWWFGFLVNQQWAHLVVVVGWVGASLWALYYSVLAVRKHEGTSIAALVRNLLPAVIAVTVVVFADVVGGYAGLGAAVDALWLVGTVLVGGFLFTTAVALRQQGGEVERMYDWTTWRGDRLDEDAKTETAGASTDD